MLLSSPAPPAAASRSRRSTSTPPTNLATAALPTSPRFRSSSTLCHASEEALHSSRSVEMRPLMRAQSSRKLGLDPPRCNFGSRSSTTRASSSPVAAAAAAAAAASSSSSPPVAASGKTKVAFLGMGIMGVAMATNLLKAGYDVTVWNRTASACDPLVANLGAKAAKSPAEAAAAADVTMAMLSDPAAAVAVAALAAPGLSESKGYYIDASTVDAETARKVSRIVKSAGAAGFLEAPVSGSKGPAIAGQLIFLASGDAALAAFAGPLLDVMGKKTFYLGAEAGLGAKMKLAVNALMGTMMASLAEQLALASACGLEPRDLLDVVSLGAVAAPMFALKGPAMAEAVSGRKGGGAKEREPALSRFPPAFPLKHQRKDLRLAVELAAQTGTPVPLAEAACELFAEAQDGELALGDADFAAVVETVASKMK